MLTLRPGSHVHLLVQALAVTGNIPCVPWGYWGRNGCCGRWCGGNRVPTHPQPTDRGGGEGQALCPSMAGGREKSLRLYKGALPLLRWLHPAAYGYYMDSFWEHHFPGDAAHRDRNYRVAEGGGPLHECRGGGAALRPAPVSAGGDSQSHTGCSRFVPGPGHQENIPR